MKLKISALNFLIVTFLTNSLYGLSFKFSQYNHQIVLDLINNNLSSRDFSIDSPLNYLIPSLLKIENFDIYLIYIFAITQITLIWICFKIQILGTYHYLFLFSGWLVSVSWFIGYQDSIVVLLTIYLFEETNLVADFRLRKLIVVIYLLTLMHSAFSLGLLIICFFLNSEKLKIKFFVFSAFAYISAFLTNQVIKSYMDFGGRGRFRFLLNNNVVSDSINLMNENFNYIFYSGFLGTIVLIVLVVFISDSKTIANVVISLIVAILLSSIALDSSRVFSILIVPVVLKIISILKDASLKIEYKKTVAIFVVVITLVFQEFHVYGKVHNSSPFNDIDLYQFFINSLDTLFSGFLT